MFNATMYWQIAMLCMLFPFASAAAIRRSCKAMAPREVIAVPVRLIATLLLLGLSISLSSAQSDEELAAIFRRGDVNRMEDIARTGDVRAETWLALMLQNRARRTEAKEWWAKAAEKDNAWAIGSLAQMHHRDGENEEAATWLRLGAEAGHPSLQIRFADVLLRGRGIEKDERAAAHWLSAAAAQGDRHAYLPLAKLYASESGIDPDPIEAYALATIAEAILTDSDFEREGEARKLRARLTSELTSEDRQAGLLRAHQIRADLSELQSAKQNKHVVATTVLLAVFSTLLACLAVMGWLIWRLARFLIGRLVGRPM